MKSPVNIAFAIGIVLAVFSLIFTSNIEQQKAEYQLQLVAEELNIKPEEILVTEEDELYITDSGVYMIDFDEHWYIGKYKEDTINKITEVAISQK